MTIKIEVDDQGNFTYYPSMLRVSAGDTIQWECPQHPFAILFKSTTPFLEGMDAHGQAGQLSEPRTVADVKGHFSYAVAVFAFGQVRLDCSCPGLLAN